MPEYISKGGRWVLKDQAVTAAPAPKAPKVEVEKKEVKKVVKKPITKSKPKKGR